MQVERMSTKAGGGQDNSDVLAQIRIRNSYDVALFRGRRRPAGILLDSKKSGVGCVRDRIKLAVDVGALFRSNWNRECDVERDRHGGLLDGNGVGFSEERRVLLQKRVVDIGAVGVGNIPVRRLGRRDGSGGFRAVGQHTTNVSDEGIVGRRS